MQVPVDRRSARAGDRSGSEAGRSVRVARRIAIVIEGGRGDVRMTTLRGPVLVWTNLSPASEEALRQAARLATEVKGTLLVCHVVPEVIPDGSVFTEFRRANLKVADSVVATARAAVEQQVRAVLGADAAVDMILEWGTPHVGLLRQAEERGAGVMVAAPGSVALDVVRHASTPVLIARPSPKGPVVGATDFSDPSLPALHTAAAEARR